MKTQRRYQPANFFVLRTPLLPLTALLRLGDEATASSAAGAQSSLDAATHHDTVRGLAYLRDMLRRADVREALLLASPSTLGAVGRALRRGGIVPDSKLALTLFKYLTRMSSRATPFGLLAGQTVGRIDGAATDLQLPDRSRYRRSSGPDGLAYAAWASILYADRPLRVELPLSVNGTLYRAAGEWRYAAPRDESGQLFERNVSAEDPWLTLAVDTARKGCTFGQLSMVLAMAGCGGASPDVVDIKEAEDYVDQLVKAGILFTSLQSVQSGLPSHLALYRTLKHYKAGRHAARRIAKWHVQCRRLIEAPFGVAVPRYRQLARVWEASPENASPSLNVSLWKPRDQLRLGPDLVEKLSRGVEILTRLSPSPTHSDLSFFVERFSARYGDALVPLAEALDEEAGLGFPAAPEHQVERAATTRRDGILRALVMPLLATGGRELALTAADVEALDCCNVLHLPTSFHVCAQVVQSERTSRGAPTTLAILACSGPSGVRMFTRFLNFDRRLRRHVRNQLALEDACADEASVHAEVVHSIGTRGDNVVARPALRPYDIVLFGRSTLSRERQLSLDELLIGVRGDVVRLWAPRLNRFVVPRLGCAHVFRNSPLAAYRFLGALQEQHSQHVLGWDWGSLGTLPFLPRLTHRDIVFSRARWRIQSSELEPLGRLGDAAQFSAVQQWRQARGIPEIARLGSEDMSLLIDFRSVWSVRLLQDEMRRCTEAMLFEELGAREGAVSDAQGAYANEIVVPFIRVASAESTRGEPARSVVDVAAAGPHAPGGEWLYLKLYGGTRATEGVLTDLHDLLQEASRRDLVNEWFFVRYADPERHIRLRLRGRSDTLWREVAPMVFQATALLVRQRVLARVVCDTYVPEVDRYGGQAVMDATTAAFHADSEAVLRLPGDHRWRRWTVASVGVERLLDDFQVAVADRASMLDEAAAQLGERGTLLSALKKLRKARGDLESRWEALHRETQGVFDARSFVFRELATQLRRAADAGSLTRSLPRIVMSHAHMHVNRMLSSQSLDDEALIYCALAARHRAIVQTGALHRGVDYMASSLVQPDTLNRSGASRKARPAEAYR